MSPRTYPPTPSPLGSEPRRRPLVSLTPLIDVVFILLVFFMLASNFLDWRSLEIATPAVGKTTQTDDRSWLVELRADGDWLLDGEPIHPDGLQTRVAERLREHPEQAILVKPEPGVPLQAAIDLLDRLRHAGAAKVSMIRGGRHE